MEKTREGLCELIEKVDICFKGRIIPDEIVLKIEKQFLTEAFRDEKKHKTLFLQHTGSEIYDAVAIAIVSLALVFLDDSKATDITKDIKEGDLVTYKSKRWIYSGTTFLEGKERYVLKDDKGCTNYLLEAAMCDVSPYNGKSTKLNGLGMGKSKSKRTDFLKKVACLRGDEIPAIPAQSLVLFIDNHKLDDLLNNVSIHFGGEHYYILDLVTASFYTDNNELKKRGNANNNEPMLKATLSMDKAREMVKEKHGNEIVGFIVFDDRAYKKYGLDLEEILYRKKLPYSLLSTRLSMDSWVRAQLENDEEIMVLPLTAEYLKSVNDKNKNKDNASESNNAGWNHKLHDEIMCACWGEARLHFVESSLSWKDFKRVKENIAFVINNCLEYPRAIEFCRWAYSMLKLFNNAIFYFEEYEKLSTGYKEFIDFKAPSIQIEEFNNDINEFPLAVRRQSSIILDYIRDKYREFYNYNPKRESFRKALKDLENTKMLIVVPSMRYKPFVERFYPKTWNTVLKNNYVVATEAQAQKLDLSKFTDIYYLSLMNSSKYNPFDNVFFTSIDILLYDTQLRLYNGMYREFVLYKKTLNKRAYAPEISVAEYEDNSQGYIIDIEEEQEKEFQDDFEIDNEIQQSFMRMFLQNERYQSQRDYSDFSEKRDRLLEAYRYANFMSGENIIFTKGYTAYVVDVDKQSVIEKNVDDLKEGDQLIFTVNDDRTKDIVDELLMGIAEKNGEIDRSYKLVQGWKESCRNYRYEHGIKYTQLSKMFTAAGYKAQPQVIRSWLDEQSHIVGPKQEDTFNYIQKVFGEECLPEPFSEYAIATKQIRSARVKILKLIEKAVISDNIEFDDSTDMYDGLKERIQEIAMVKQIDHIETIEPFEIAGYRANKPLEN